jgi:hypothetical protein
LQSAPVRSEDYVEMCTVACRRVLGSASRPLVAFGNETNKITLECFPDAVSLLRIICQYSEELNDMTDITFRKSFQSVFQARQETLEFDKVNHNASVSKNFKVNNIWKANKQAMDNLLQCARSMLTNVWTSFA